MSEAQKRFNEATNKMDRAYWQGTIDGEQSGKESVINILKNLLIMTIYDITILA